MTHGCPCQTLGRILILNSSAICSAWSKSCTFFATYSASYPVRRWITSNILVLPFSIIHAPDLLICFLFGSPLGLFCLSPLACSPARCPGRLWFWRVVWDHLAYSVVFLPSPDRGEFFRRSRAPPFLRGGRTRGARTTTTGGRARGQRAQTGQAGQGGNRRPRQPGDRHPETGGWGRTRTARTTDNRRARQPGPPRRARRNGSHSHSEHRERRRRD